MRPIVLLLLLAPQAALADCIYTGAKRAYIECIYGEVLATASDLLGLGSDLTSAQGDIGALQTTTSDLDARVDDAEAGILALEGQVDLLTDETTSLFDSLSGLLTAVPALDGRVAVLEAAIPGASPSDPADSCLEILNAAPGAPSGVYWLTPDGQSARRAWCDMETDGGGWTLCLNSRYTQQAAALFTSTYSKVVADHPGGFYDWCDQDKTEYLFSLADESLGSYRLHTSTMKISNPTPYNINSEWSSKSLTFSSSDVAWLNTPPGVDKGCSSFQLDMWQYINPGPRGLRGFKRGHIKCDVSGSDPGISFVMGAGCNYDSCTSTPQYEYDLYPTYSAWTWNLTATVGGGNNMWRGGPYRGDRVQLYYR